MAINTDVKERITITIEKEIKKKYQEYAKKESRTLSSYIVNALKEYEKNHFSKE